jgi:hypothetical protein
MGGEIEEIVVFTCAERRKIDRARLIPVFAQQTPQLAVCIQGFTEDAVKRGLLHNGYWSEVFLYDVDTGHRQAPLPILTQPGEFVATPGPGIVPGLTVVVPGQLAGLSHEEQAVVSANLAYSMPAFSFPVPVPAVKKVRFEEAVDLHALGIRGVALSSPSRPPLVRTASETWRMLEGTLRPHRLYAARPNILIGVGATSTGATAAVAWNIDSPFVLHAFGGRKNIRQVAVSTSGDRVAIADHEELSIHGVNGEELHARLPVRSRLDAVLVDDTIGGVYVVCVFDTGIEVWNAEHGKAVADLPAVGEQVLEACFVPSATGTKLALVTADRVVIRPLA